VATAATGAIAGADYLPDRYDLWVPKGHHRMREAWVNPTPSSSLGNGNDPARRKEDDEMADSPVLDRVRELVAPILEDLGLELYDCEFAGGTLRVVIDTPPASPGGVDLEQLSLVTRLVSRELDHQDPVPGRYTLEVTSPGLERALRRPEHYAREVGKTVAVRLHQVVDGRRRLEGTLVEADGSSIVLACEGRRIELDIDQIERARTVFVWGPTPKPGRGAGSRPDRTSLAESEESVSSTEAPR
jgi:ribosome maturation factor RimP